MIKVYVKVEALQPLVLGDGMISNQNVRSTLDHIPGGILRGAIAQAILERLGIHTTSRRVGGSASGNLQQLFESCFPKVGGPRFGFLYPGEGDVIPGMATALKCREEASHLFDKLLAALNDKSIDLQCPQCGGRLERERGYLVLDTGDWKPVKTPPKRSYVRVGLNRMTETAEDSFLYVLDSLEPTVAKKTEGETHEKTQYESVVFSGNWWFETDSQWQSFQELLKESLGAQGNTCELRIGSARARGFGKIKFSWSEEKIPDLAERVDGFDSAVGKDRFYFTLMARTPVLGLEANGQSARTLSPDLLREYLPGLPSSVQEENKGTFVERENISGWSQMWGLPKPLLPAIARGSVFTYSADRQDRDTVLAWLQQLEQNGVGERLQEGYGQIEVNSPFHTDKGITIQEKIK